MRKNLRWLYSFCTVARVLNYKRAAEELFLTPSAISHQMSELELQLGAKLFQRTTRSMVLTSEGLKLYQKILPHLQAIDIATQEVSGPKAKQHLHVQLPEFFASELLMPAIPEFASNNKNIELQIEGADINENKNPKADVTILLNQNKPKSKITSPLFPIRYVPACSKAFLEANSSSTEQPIEIVNKSTLITHSSRPTLWSRWKDYADLKMLQPEKLIYVDSMFALARAAESGVGIALVPLPISQAWLNNNTLVTLHHKQLITEDFYWISINDDTVQTRAARVFVDWLIKKFSNVS